MTIEERIHDELVLLRGKHPALVVGPDGRWVRIPAYPLPPGWNRATTDVAFRIVDPPAAPYGIYVPIGLLFNGQRPSNYGEPASGVPFPGSWGVFSWTPEGWMPGTTAASGSNYCNWVVGFGARFREGV